MPYFSDVWHVSYQRNSAKLWQQISGPHNTCEEVAAGTVWCDFLKNPERFSTLSAILIRMGTRLVAGMPGPTFESLWLNIER
jgi:hypothetical protein